MMPKGMTYLSNRTFDHTANVVHDNHSGLKKRKEVLEKRDAVLLLFARGVDVGEKEGYIMMAYQCHHAGVIINFHRGFFFFSMNCFIR